jgi:RNA polymerase sigma-B factor
MQTAASCNQTVHYRNQIAHKNEKLVHKVVHRMTATCREPYEDLYQIGYIGLLKAAERYDSSSGNAFSSFAVPYIQGEIQHYLRDQWQVVKPPRSSLEMKAKVRRLQKSLASLGRETDALQIALGLGVSEEKWREIDAIDGNITVSLHELLYEPPFQLEEVEPEQELISKHLANLQPLQRIAIVENFLHSTSIADIAKKQNKSQEKIRACINLGLTKIRISISKETL